MAKMAKVAKMATVKRVAIYAPSSPFLYGTRHVSVDNSKIVRLPYGPKYPHLSHFLPI